MNLAAWRNSYLLRSLTSVLLVAAALYTIEFAAHLPIHATIVLGFYLSLIFVSFLPVLMMPADVTVMKLFKTFLVTVPLRFILVPIYLIIPVHYKLVELIYFLPACLLVYIVSHLVDIPHYFRLDTRNAT